MILKVKINRKHMFNFFEFINLFSVQIITSNPNYSRFTPLMEDLTGFKTISIKTEQSEIAEDKTIVKDILKNEVNLYMTIPEELKDSLFLDQEKLRKQKEKLKNELRKINTSHCTKISAETQKVHKKRVSQFPLH